MNCLIMIFYFIFTIVFIIMKLSRKEALDIATENIKNNIVINDGSFDEANETLYDEAVEIMTRLFPEIEK